MLVLTRRVEEELVIGKDVRLKIVGIAGGRVRLGISAPAAVPVRRAELCPGQENLVGTAADSRAAADRV